MGFVVRKRAALGKAARINLSKGGASLGVRVGRTSLTSSGRVSVRVVPGVSYRLGQSHKRKGLFG